MRQGKIQNNSSQQFWIQGSKFRRKFQSGVHDVSITKIPSTILNSRDLMASIIDTRSVYDPKKGNNVRHDSKPYPNLCNVYLTGLSNCEPLKEVRITVKQNDPLI